MAAFGGRLVIWAMKNYKSAYPLQQFSVLLTKSTMVLYLFFGHITPKFDYLRIHHFIMTMPHNFFVRI